MRLLLADERGTIYQHPYLKAVAWNGDSWMSPRKEELIPMPEGSKIFTLPGRFPVGYDQQEKSFVPVTRFRVEKREFRPSAVSVFMPPAYMRTLLPAYSRISDAEPLEQWAYAFASGGEECIMTAGVRVDSSNRWEAEQFDDRIVEKKVREVLSDNDSNRLIEHIAHCATQYHCFAAKNFFLGRWEIGLPTSRKCNAACLGCLSLQAGDTPSSHQRISFTPTAEEIAGIAIRHFENGDDPLASFGQGCEGDPLTEWNLIVEAIRLIRKSTEKGTLHMNTNGSLPGAVPELAKAGLNSVRISLNSARKLNYEAYFKPEGYSFGDVIEFITQSKKHGLFIHINLLIMPGLSDLPVEMEAFSDLVDKTGVDLVQLKNLNIDPEIYFDAMERIGTPVGMQNMWERLRQDNPKLRFGYFNLQREKFKHS